MSLTELFVVADELGDIFFGHVLSRQHLRGQSVGFLGLLYLLLCGKRRHRGRVGVLSRGIRIHGAGVSVLVETLATQ